MDWHLNARRIAILSNIHGALVALRAVLADGEALESLRRFLQANP